GEGHGRQHEENGRNRSRFGESRGRAARAKRGLTALPAEGCRDVSGLAALQQNDDDQKQTNDDVDDGNKNDEHGIEGPKFFRMSAMVRMENLNYSITMITRSLCILHPGRHAHAVRSTRLFVYCVAASCNWWLREACSPN